MEKWKLLQQVVLGKLDKYVQKMNLDHSLTTYIKINSKWIEDLNIRPEIIQLLKENRGSKLSNISLSVVFLGMSP